MGCDDLILEIHAISARPSHRLPCPDNYLPYYSKWNHFFANDGILIEHQQTLQFEIFAKFVLLFKKCHNSFGNYEIIVNFVPSTPNTQGRKAAVKGGMHIYGKAFTKRLVFGFLESSKSYPVKEQGNSRCSLGMFYTLYLIYIRIGFVYTYSAWASGVARSTGRAVLEP